MEDDLQLFKSIFELKDMIYYHSYAGCETFRFCVCSFCQTFRVSFVMNKLGVFVPFVVVCFLILNGGGLNRIGMLVVEFI